MIIRNKFSWSLRRYSLFNFCERAYYFCYYGSWNGWAPHASKELKIAFRLKHLLSKELWLENIIKKGVCDIISTDPCAITSKELTNHCLKLLSRDIKSLYAEDWKNDPKKICLEEIYYKKNSVDEVVTWIKDKTRNKLEIFQNSKPFHRLSQIPYSAFYDTSRPLSFKLNDIQVWCSPDLIWDLRGQKHIINLDNSSNWSFRAGVNLLYAKEKLRSIPVCHTLFIDDNNCFSVYGIRSPKELISIIIKSSNKMLSRLTYHQKAYIENFSPTSDLKKCELCSFKKICSAN